MKARALSALGVVVVALLAAGSTVAGTGGTAFQPACAPPSSNEPAAAVCPFIATSASANDFPGADAPLGMVQWSPDTTTRPAGGGYEYDDNQILGFSLTHIAGPGCGVGGDIPILPWVGDPANNKSVSFDHTNEDASPGYYEVVLHESGDVKTELTATTRSGLGRFTFPQGMQSSLLLNLYGAQMHVTKAAATTVGTNEVTGWAQVGGDGGNGFCGERDAYKIYFSLEFNRPISGCGTWNGGSVTAGSPAAGCTADDGSSSLYVSFDTTTQPVVLARVGVSYVSTANALLNAKTEDPNGLAAGGFDAVRKQTYGAWNKLLSRISVTGGSTDERVVFYTALYHVLLHPNVFSDVNGQYPGFATYENSSNASKIYTAKKGHAQYANYSGWDVYRSELQLLALLDPAAGSDIAQSMLNDYAQGGTLPKWALNNGESYVMDGDPSEAMLADLYAFGAKNFDTKTALADMIAQATKPNYIRPGMAEYDGLHYLPVDGSYSCCWWGGSVSTAQEYTVADDAIAQFATALGDTANAQKFLTRAQNWQYLFDPSAGLNGFVQEKYKDGQFMTPFVPEYGNTLLEGGYTEGDAYQYTPMVEFNVHALANAMGGNTAYAQYLDGLTAAFADPGGNLNSPVTAPGPGTATNLAETQTIFGGGVLPFAWMGNEPSLEIPWEYDYIGAPYRTQDVVRRVAVEIYTNSPTGMPGNDDLGTMSAALVWEDLGLFPIVPGNGTLALASSLFSKVTIPLPSGKTLTISAPNASDSNRYVQSMTVNGQPWSKTYLPASILTSGGTVVENLGGSPNTSWATGADAAPPSYSTGQLPGIGFTTPSGVAPSHGALLLGVQNVGDQPIAGVQWSAKTTAGVTVSPASGTIASVPACSWTVPPAKANVVPSPCGSATTSVTVTTAPGTAQGQITFTLTAGGKNLPPVVDEIGCASGPQPGVSTCSGGGSSCATPAAPSGVDNLGAFYDNAGISDDCTNTADFDAEAYSYSAQGLTAAGLVPGKSVLWNGFVFQWPSVPAGAPDNVEAAGQTIPLTAAAGTSAIGLLGSASNGPITENVVVTYSDGSTASEPLCFDDWTLGGSNGGAANMTCAGNGLVAATAYRNFPTGPDRHLTNIFGASIPVDPAKTVASVTLPPAQASVNITLGEIHVFAISTQTLPLLTG